MISKSQSFRTLSTYPVKAVDPYKVHLNALLVYKFVIHKSTDVYVGETRERGRAQRVVSVSVGLITNYMMKIVVA